jgi:MEDS: MEthanogen/methylotroph, DcmR Sensory domain
VVNFLETGASAGEPMLVAVPAGNRAALQAAADGRVPDVRFVDMAGTGRNPGRIMPAIRAFVDQHGGRRVRFRRRAGVAGPHRRGDGRGNAPRGADQPGFADLPVTILCPYDVAGLPAEVLADAASTHPEVVAGGACQASGAYAEPASSPIVHDLALPDPGGPCGRSSPTASLAALRRFARQGGVVVELADRVTSPTCSPAGATPLRCRRAAAGCGS